MVLYKPTCRFEPVSNLISAQLAGWGAGGAVEYTNCFFVEGEDPHHNECPGDDTKQFDGKAPAMLELWGMWSSPSLPLLPGPLWPGGACGGVMVSKLH